MITSRHLASYEANKLENLQSIQIINDIEDIAGKYYRVNLTDNDIKLDCNLEEWNLDQFLHKSHQLNLKYVEVFIYKGYKKDFISLDEFMSYVQLINNQKKLHLIKHPFTRMSLNKEEFLHNIHLYIDEHFMQCTTTLDILYYESYSQGGFYYNPSYSFMSLGCELDNEFWAFN